MSTRNLALRHTIRKATIKDCGLINRLAWKIYVLPDFQGCHCGSALFRHAVAYVRRVCPEARAIELNVNRQNPALGFYRRMGMRIDREGDFDIGNGFYMNDYIMRLEL